VEPDFRLVCVNVNTTDATVCVSVRLSASLSSQIWEHKSARFILLRTAFPNFSTGRRGFHVIAPLLALLRSKSRRH
jgi:hypothetical protein